MNKLDDIIKNDDVGEFEKRVTNENVDDDFGWYSNYLIRAVDDGAIKCVRYLISIGADVNFCDHYGGRNALHHAIQKEHIEIVRILLETNIDINHPTGWAITPIFLSIVKCLVDITKLLIDRGADITKTKWKPPDIENPLWFDEIIKKRTQTRNQSLIFIGIHKFKRTTVPVIRDVTRHIGKHIWSMRFY
jgi:hypothetical protein